MPLRLLVLAAVLLAPLAAANAQTSPFERLPDHPLAQREAQSNAALWGDVDGDGDLDLFISHGANNTNDRNVLYRNRTAERGGDGWLALRLTGTVSNRSAIGARVDVYAAVGGERRRMVRVVESRSGRSAQAGFRLHVGMGDASAADSVVIRWPSGARQRLEGLAANQTVLVVEPGATSANPSLSTLDGLRVGAPRPNPAGRCGRGHWRCRRGNGKPWSGPPGEPRSLQAPTTFGSDLEGSKWCRAWSSRGSLWRGASRQRPLASG